MDRSNVIAGMCWALGGFLMLMGAFAEVAFEPQYLAAAHVLVIGSLVFIGFGIAADRLEV